MSLVEEFEGVNVERMLDNLPIGVIIIKAMNNRILFVNKAAQELFGKNIGLELSELPKTAPIKILTLDGNIVSLEQLPANQALQGKVVRQLEVIIEQPNSKRVFVKASASPILRTDGQIVGAIGLFENITERKKAEEALKVSEEQARQSTEELQKLMDVIPAAVWVSNDPECRVIYGNQMANSFYEASGGENVSAGTANGEEKNKKRRFLRAGKELSPEELPMQKAAKTNKEVKNAELEVMLPSGRKMSIFGSAKPLLDNQGKVRGCLGAFVDITDHKKAEEELKKLNIELEERVKQRVAQVSAERLRLYNVLETLPSYVILLDKDHHVRFANKIFRDTFGEDQGRPCHRFLFNKEYECENCETYKVLKENKPQHWYWTGPNGRDYSIYDFPFQEADGSTLILEMGIDITDQKRAEDLAHAAAQYSRGLIEASLDPLVTINPEGKITDVNAATETATGSSREELIGSDFSDYFTEPEKARAGYMKAFANGFVKDYPLAIKHNSGKVIEVLYNATVYTNGKGEMQGVFAAARDITDLKRAENILNKKQEELNRILDSSPTIVFYKDKEGKIIQANKAFADSLKIPKEKLLGKTVFDLYSTKTAQGMTNDDKIVFESKRPMMNIEEQYESATGLRWIRTDKIPTFDEKGSVTGLIGFSEDITDRKKAEKMALESAKKLKDAERLAAIGATAGMVGHDIRNPLQSMTSDIYLIREEIATSCVCKDKEELIESLVSLDENISYINKIVQDLQDYARPLMPEYSVVNLSNVLVKLFENIKVPESVKLSNKVKDLEKLRTDPMMLQRALSNLVTNAIQAMPNGGTLEIEGFPEKDWVVITISDTGVGIPEEIKPKLFTPMMTTKPKGQGFGLAVSKRLIEAMKGNLSFESEIGKGTKFIIELPLIT